LAASLETEAFLFDPARRHTTLDLDQALFSSETPSCFTMWQPISSAPFDRDLELAVNDIDGPHALVFPCRNILVGWVNGKRGSALMCSQPTARMDDRGGLGPLPLIVWLALERGDFGFFFGQEPK
jgi:hypothetical protein